MMNSILTRKNFIKTFSLSLAYSSLLGRAWSHVTASEISSMSSNTGVLRIRLQDFPALQAESGSVRIALNPVNGNQGPNGSFYPVIINRGANNVFYALSSRCAHRGCIVEALDASVNEMNCFCHGSVYAIDGKRVSGPAPSGLTTYTVTFDGVDVVEAKISALTYSLSVASVQPVAAGARRLELTFRSFRNVDYEVQYRKDVKAEPVVVPFSLTAAGDADQTVYTAPSAATTRFYVETNSPAGFYTVAVRLAEI